MEELLVRWLRLAAARIAGERERLTDLDAAIGDGDHGINMDRGFREVVRRLDTGACPTDPPAAVLEATGRILIGTVGGASGALYGRGFQHAGTTVGRHDRVDEIVAPARDRADGGPPDGREARALIALTAAIEAIAALGRAVPGEKTMLDALAPARVAFAHAVQAGSRLPMVTAQAAGAAEAGALATIPLLATKGRASYLGERSIGHLDPGAASSALLLRALADVAAEG
jgi:dihydroxyacetone kinase-like protein